MMSGVAFGLVDDDLGRLLDIVVVADAEDELQPELVSFDGIFEYALGERRVGDREQFVVERPDAGHGG